MRVKLHNDGYTKIYENGDKTSVNGDYNNDKEVVDFVSNGGVIEPFETQVEIDARVIAEANTAAKKALVDIDIASVRSIREYLASLPDAPLFIKDKENEAKLERAKLK